MKKILEKISKNLSKLRNNYPELDDLIRKGEGGELKLPRIDVNRALDISSSEIVEFIHEFYGVNVILSNKKDLRRKRQKKSSKNNDIQSLSLPGEIWKDILDNRYKISNLGRIVNWKNRILTPRLNRAGFLFVTIKNKPYLIHILVANNFLRKSRNKKYVKHIDGDKLNNTVSNLSWVDYSTINTGQKPGKSKGDVYKYSLDNELLDIYKSTIDASKKSGVNQSNLAKVLSSSGGNRVKYKGFIWERKQ